MPIPIWAGRYIGLPFKSHGRDRAGLDCWGLVRLVFAEQYGVGLPSLIGNYRAMTDGQDIGRLILREIPKWEKRQYEDEEAGDVVVMRVRGQPMHVGLILGDKCMLHVEKGVDSAIERYMGPNWASRIYGFYRYKAYGADEGI